MRLHFPAAAILAGIAVSLSPASAQNTQNTQNAQAAPTTQSTPIPIEDFVKRPNFENVTLSPDGKSLAVVARHRGRANLAIIDLETRKLRRITDYDRFDVYEYEWLSNDRVLVSVVDNLDDASGEIYARGSFAINTDGGSVREINGVDVLGESSEKPGSLIVFGAGRSGGTDVFRMDSRTGRQELLTFDTPGNVVDWVVDRSDEVRIAVSSKDFVVKIFHRDNQKSPWVKLEEFDTRKYNIVPLAFDYDNRTLYVRSNRDRNSTALFRYDLDKKALGELVAENDVVDIGGLRFDTAKKKMVGIDTGSRSRTVNPSGMKWLDPEWERVQKMVDAALPGRVNQLSWGSKMPHQVLVSSRSDTYPGGYFLLDTRSNKMEPIAEKRPWIDAARMSPARSVHYKARDGLQIPAMLTMPRPVDGSVAKNLPLIVDIHGGPHAPGAGWGFDETAQFLASRGYAVLQPNFRGTAGYGRKFLEAGFRQWGLAMQDDITDGVAWAVKQGYADPKRVCLMGASYGGYAALYGLIKEQGMFRCGIAAVAVTDLELLFSIAWSDTYRSKTAQTTLRERIGDPKKDVEQFRKISPLYQAANISAPVLLAFGSDDRRVPVVHGQELKAALDKNNKPYEWIVYTGEGHGFNKSENRIDYFKRIEAFLDKHLRVQP